MPDKKINLWWWGPPKNFSDRQNERKISWLELFYDLVYVGAISQLAHHLAEDPAWHEIGYLSLLFSLIFWSWVNGSLYYDLHGNDGIRTRFFTLLQMLAVAAVSITLKDAFEGHQRNFAISFLMVQFLITYLWWTTGYYDPSHKALNKYYIILYSIGMALLAISIFTTFKIAVILWVLLALCDLGVGLVAAASTLKELRRRGEVFSASASLVERFGLFTIIVLGETILGILTGISDIQNKTWVVWLAFILCIVIAFLLWWIYFDMAGDRKIKQGYKYLQLLIFLHIPLLASLGVVGACIRVILPELSASELHERGDVKLILCVAIATILFMISIISAIMQKEEARSYIRPISRLLFIIGIVILIAGMFSSYFNIITFLTIITIALFIPVFIGAHKWVNYKLFKDRKP